MIIQWENIQQDSLSEFEKESESRVDSLGIGYDYNSIMHYDPILFSKNGPTIVANDPHMPFGMARELSDLDIIQINLLYKCPGTCNYN